MRCLLLLPAGFTTLLATAAAAQELDPRLYPKFEAGASGTLLLLSETIRIDPRNRPGNGTEIDAEDVLGVSRTSLQPEAHFRWRPGRRHELELRFLRAVRSAEKVLQDSIAVRDTSFAPGLTIDSDLRTSQAFLTYRYAFRARPETQLGLGIGLGIVFFRFKLGVLAGTTPYSSTSEFNAPTGSIGAYGRFKLGDRWYLDSDLRGVYLKIQNLKATVGEAAIAGRYFLSNSVAAELGYNLGLYKVTLDKTASGSGFAGNDLEGVIKYSVNGFRGGLVIAF
jgi:hypothetical protein